MAWAVGILVTVAAGLLLAGILAAIKMRFDLHPVLELTYNPGRQQSGRERPNGLKCEWHGEISLYNPSAHDAYRVCFLFPETWSLPRPELSPPHVSTKETKTAPFTVTRVFDRAEVFPHEHEPPRPDFNPPAVVPLRDLYPEDLRAFEIVVQYENSKGLRFYTLFRKEDGAQSSEPKRWRPRTKSPNQTMESSGGERSASAPPPLPSIHPGTIVSGYKMNRADAVHFAPHCRRSVTGEKDTMTSRTLPDGRIPRGSLAPANEERMYAAIGRAVTEFGALELALDEYLIELIKITDPKPKRNDVTKMHSFRQKVTLLQELVSKHFDPTTPTGPLAASCSLLTTACDRRDDIAHSKCLPIAGQRENIHQEWTPGRCRKKMLNGELARLDSGVFTMTVKDVEDAHHVIEDAACELHGLMNNSQIWTPNNTSELTS